MVASAGTETSAASRWEIAGPAAITWSPRAGENHSDNIEMSGRQVSVIITYSVEASGHVAVTRQVIWPMLRFHPNKTRDHFTVTFRDELAPRFLFDRSPVRREVTRRITHRGWMEIEGAYGEDESIAYRRIIFPSVDKPLAFDRTVLTNRSGKPVLVDFDGQTQRVDTGEERGIYGAYHAIGEITGPARVTLQPGESATYDLVLAARSSGQPPYVVGGTGASAIDVAAELQDRQLRVAEILGGMQLSTPVEVLNTLFALAKIRATESIYATKGGLMHGPGGGDYYAAIWANDQPEYANPFFAMLGDASARESALNSFRHFARYMNPEFKPIPSSIISEGAGFWHGAGDRGDMAMIAYGAGRFALARGDQAVASELWPLITWCLDYCSRKVTADGVVASDSDELENRFPSGRANLSTSCLYYDALLSAADLAGELGQPPALAEGYRRRAVALRAAIESYFGRKIAGFETYRYFDRATPSAQARHAHYAEEPDHLRAWICLPLTVGIFDRTNGTIEALFSPQLWSADGLATEAGKITFWDRSTLCALRGVFAAGETQRALDHLQSYSRRRLLGDHVPYPVEAYPEGNQRHLSAESALYCRIFTEGLFGLRPVGLRAFTLTPRLPKDWPEMSLRRVHAFGAVFDLTVRRKQGGLLIEVAREGQAPAVHAVLDGGTQAIEFSSPTPSLLP